MVFQMRNEKLEMMLETTLEMISYCEKGFLL